LLECELQRAESGRFDGDRVELERAVLFVDGEAAANDELQSVLDFEADEARVRREEDDLHLRAGVFD